MIPLLFALALSSTSAADAAEFECSAARAEESGSWRSAFELEREAAKTWRAVAETHAAEKQRLAGELELLKQQVDKLNERLLLGVTSPALVCPAQGASALEQAGLGIAACLACGGAVAGAVWLYREREP